MLIKEYSIGNKTLKIVSDDSAESPRENCNIGTLVFRGNSVGDQTDFRFAEGYRSEADALEKGPKEIKKHFGELGAILPVYKYEHSGVVYSTTPFTCPYDSGLIGFIFSTKKIIRENWSLKRVTKAFVSVTESHLASEVETFSQWAEGDIVGYQLEVDGEETESCYGFYGQDVTTNGILENVGDEWKEVVTEEVAV